MARQKAVGRIYTTPLENIRVDTETNEIFVSADALVQEAEDRTHASGPKTDLEKRLDHKKQVSSRHSWWPEEKKIEVAALYASGVVNSTDLERLTGVPGTAIRTWKQTDWWPELLERIHSEVDNDIVSKFTNIVDKSLETIQDRLINGDYYYNKKSGEIHRRPVSMRDANIVATSMVDKRQLLRGKATSRSESGSVDARLLKLAEEFKKFAAAKEINPAEGAITLETQG